MDNMSILEVAHEMARDLHEIGLMSDERLREFDIMCRPSSVYTPTQIRRIREQTDSSQDAFAASLDVSKATVRRWEKGTSRPGDASLRLLQRVEREGLGGLG